jgi:hypothetical protein
MTRGEDKTLMKSLSHAEREAESQWAQQRVRTLSIPKLRMVRARLADMIESDIPAIVRDRATIRGEFVHKAIIDSESESMLGRLGRKFGRFGPEKSSFIALLTFSEIHGYRGARRGNKSIFLSQDERFRLEWIRVNNTFEGLLSIEGEVITKRIWDPLKNRSAAMRLDELGVLVEICGNDCVTRTLFRRIDQQTFPYPALCHFE